MRCLLLILFVSCSVFASGQSSESLIAVSGVVYEERTVRTIPYATVQIAGTAEGTISAANGFFSIVAAKGDTLRLSSVGYQPVLLPIPDTLQVSRITLMVPMQIDTIMLEEAVVYPWPSREQFREAFLALETRDINELQMMPIPGIRKIENPVPIQPHPFWNPASFFYEELFLKTLDRLPKKNKAKTLPKWE